jgi:hypothetical protein
MQCIDGGKLGMPEATEKLKDCDHLLYSYMAMSN